MSANNTLVFGTDPEFFAGYKKDGKDYVLPPAYFRTYLDIPFEPDDKHPVILDATEELGVKIIEDGVAFEETVTPDTNWRNLFARVQTGKELLSKYILSKFPDHCEPDVKTIPTINYDVARWSEEGPDFQNCLIFGCDRDFNADDMKRENKVVDALLHPFRYGGGHIHVSGSAKIKEEPILAIQSLKFTAGLAAVAFSDVPELDHLRTYLYGQPDRYRPQEYKKLFNGISNTDFGVEYRTPSNRWTNSIEHAEKVFSWIEIGIRNLLEGGLVLNFLREINNETRQAIIDCNQPLAKELLSYVESKI